MGMYGDLSYSEERPQFIGLPIEDYKKLNTELYESYNRAKDTYDELSILEKNLQVLPNTTDIQLKKQQIAKTKNIMKDVVDKADYAYAMPMVQNAVKDFRSNVALQGAMQAVKDRAEYHEQLEKTSRDKWKWSDEKLNIAKALADAEYKGQQYIDPITNKPLVDANDNPITPEQDVEGKGMWHGKYKGRVLSEEMEGNKMLNELTEGFKADVLDRYDADYDKATGKWYMIINNKRTEVTAQDLRNYGTGVLASHPKWNSTLQDYNYLGQGAPISRLNEAQQLLNTLLQYKDTELRKIVNDPNNPKFSKASNESKNNYIESGKLKESNRWNPLLDNDGNSLLQPGQTVKDLTPEQRQIYNNRINNLNNEVLIKNIINKYGFVEEDITVSAQHSPFALKQMEIDASKSVDFNSNITPSTAITSTPSFNTSQNRQILKIQLEKVNKQIATASSIDKPGLVEKRNNILYSYKGANSVQGDYVQKLISFSPEYKTLIKNNLNQNPDDILKFFEEQYNASAGDKTVGLDPNDNTVDELANLVVDAKLNKINKVDVCNRLIDYFNYHGSLGASSLAQNWNEKINDIYDVVKVQEQKDAITQAADDARLRVLGGFAPLAYAFEKLNQPVPRMIAENTERLYSENYPDINMYTPSVVSSAGSNKDVLSIGETNMKELLSAGTKFITPVKDVRKTGTIDLNEGINNDLTAGNLATLSKDGNSYITVSAVDALDKADYKLGKTPGRDGEKWDLVTLKQDNQTIYRKLPNGDYVAASYLVQPESNAARQIGQKVAATYLGSKYFNTIGTSTDSKGMQRIKINKWIMTDQQARDMFDLWTASTYPDAYSQSNINAVTEAIDAWTNTTITMGNKIFDIVPRIVGDDTQFMLQDKGVDLFDTKDDKGNILPLPSTLEEIVATFSKNYLISTDFGKDILNK